MQAVKSHTPMAIMAARELVSSASSVKILWEEEEEEEEELVAQLGSISYTGPWYLYESKYLCACVCVCVCVI